MGTFTADSVVMHSVCHAGTCNTLRNSLQYIYLVSLWVVALIVRVHDEAGSAVKTGVNHFLPGVLLNCAS